MTSHLFGGVWCASSATCALRYTTKDDQFHDETIKNIVRRNFYVDDCLVEVNPNGRRGPSSHKGNVAEPR